MAACIIDRGRGPEIEGTRITVFDIMDFKDDWTAQQMAEHFEISTEEVLAALQYIEEHLPDVTAEYQTILERSARGNPPELQARLDEDHEKFLHWVQQRRLACGDCTRSKLLQ